MTLREFIRENRDELDRLINGAIYRYDGEGGQGEVPDPPASRNDEGLYNWARSSGARV